MIYTRTTPWSGPSDCGWADTWRFWGSAVADQLPDASQLPRKYREETPEVLAIRQEFRGFLSQPVEAKFLVVDLHATRGP